MCGFLISGKHSYYDVQRGLDVMSYRGTLPPTIEGYKGWVVGHVRLPIQSSAASRTPEWGAQPFPAGGGLSVFVGELFGDAGGTMELYAWDQIFGSWNTHYLHELDGFWAAANVSPSGRLRVLTDHLGIKPVYFWEEEMMVCSEITPMFQVARKTPQMDEVYLANCIKFGYDYSGRTPWKGVRQIRPGTCLVVDAPNSISDVLKEEVYWDWSRVPHDPETLLADLINDAVKNRVLGLVDDSLAGAPVLLLSGGLDSSIIYYSCQNLDLLDHIHLMSFENGEGEFLPDDDIFYMKPVSDPESSSLPLLAMQAPMDLGSLYPQFDMAKQLASHEHRVILTGDGADELFGGYRRAGEYDSQASDVFCELPFYHLPRLDRIHMRFTQEVRSPYLAPAIVRRALSYPYEDRTQKQMLKNAAWDLGVPEAIIRRPKHPLKSPAVIEGGVTYRRKLVQDFRHIYQEVKDAEISF